MYPLAESFRGRVACAAMVLGVLALPMRARADDPACAATSSQTRVRFFGMGPVDFGPGFTGTLGGSQLGLEYNLLLQGNYDWEMPGSLTVRWPPALRVGAVGDPGRGRLTVQYGLRLQTSVRLLGTTIPLPLTEWVGMADRFERGQSMFTPWAWDGRGTDVRITASERLLRQDQVNNVPLAGTLYYRIYGRYNLTTTIRTREISFPQANSAITQMNPEADVAPRTNGDLNLRAVWNGALRYVGSFQIRVQVRCQQTVSVPVVGIVICDPNTWRDVDGEVPFASAMEQQFSSDQNTLVMLPGIEADPGFELDFGRVRLGLLSRREITFRNPGRLTTAITPAASTEAVFQYPTDALCVTGGGMRQLSVRFVPDRVGPFETTLNVASTAAGVPGLMIRLRGEGFDPSTPLPDAGAGPRDAGMPVVGEDVPPSADDAGVPPDPFDPGPGDLVEAPAGGCNCRVTDGPVGRRVGALPLALGAALWAGLRRRRRAR